MEPQTETNWRLADQYQVPRLCFINKLDRIGADAYPVFDQIRNPLGAMPLVLQLPIGTAGTFRGVIDLVNMQALIWPVSDRPEPFVVQPIPAEMQDMVARYRARLVELAVEQDDTALAAYLEGEGPSQATLRACIRQGTLSGAFVPVLMGLPIKTWASSRCWMQSPPTCRPPAQAAAYTIRSSLPMSMPICRTGFQGRKR